MTPLSSLLARVRRDQDHAASAGADYVGVNHPTVHAMLAIIEEQWAALMLCRDAAPEFAARRAGDVIDRVQAIAAEVRPVKRSTNPKVR